MLRNDLDPARTTQGVLRASAGDSPATPEKAGDEAAAGSPATGENVCPSCGGSGRLDAAPCPECDGTGKVTTAIGGG